MPRPERLTWLFGLSMLLTAWMTFMVTPRAMNRQSLPATYLQDNIPTAFGDWQSLDNIGNRIVNPELQQALNRIYNQEVNLNYFDVSGDEVMLSIAYGANQTDEFAAHDPAGCYPAQGLSIVNRHPDILHTSFGDLPVIRMATRGQNRLEDVTYWFVVGQYITNNDWTKKKIQLRYALRRKIPDGLIFRVSSLDRDPARAWQLQDRFLKQFLNNLSPTVRQHLIGTHFSRAVSIW